MKKDQAEAKLASSGRVPGQGAREKSNELAKKHPIRTLLSKLTFDIIPTEENAWRIGAEVEEEIGRILAELPAGHWIVRHDVMIGPRWNVDHIAVGPPGIFAIDAKFRSGRVTCGRGGVWVDGIRTDMADKARAAANEVSSRFERISGTRHWVTPVLAFAADVEGRNDPVGVDLVVLDELFDYLRSQPRQFSPSEVSALGAILQDDRVWIP